MDKNNPPLPLIGLREKIWDYAVHTSAVQYGMVRKRAILYKIVQTRAITETQSANYLCAVHTSAVQYGMVRKRARSCKLGPSPKRSQLIIYDFLPWICEPVIWRVFGRQPILNHLARLCATLYVVNDHQKVQHCLTFWPMLVGWGCRVFESKVFFVLFLIVVINVVQSVEWDYTVKFWKEIQLLEDLFWWLHAYNQG